MMEGEESINKGEERWVEDFDTVCAPVIDLSRLNDDSPSERFLLVQDIGKACKEFGFFQVINHGISPSIMEEALSSAGAFFRLPTEEKRVFVSNDVRQPVRYQAWSSPDGVAGHRAFLKHYAHPLHQWTNLWPSKPTHYREKMGKYGEEVRRLALQLLEIAMESLGLEDPWKTYLQGRFEEGTQVVVVNGYYPSPYSPRSDDLTVSMPAHSDFGCITVLLQGRPGLQVVDPTDLKWKWVPSAPPGSLHVHLGDHLEVLTNGSYKGVNHRVILDGHNKERVSVGSIHCLPMEDRIEVLEAMVDEQNPRANYRATSFQDFLDYISGNRVSASNGVLLSYIDSLKIIN